MQKTALLLCLLVAVLGCGQRRSPAPASPAPSAPAGPTWLVVSVHDGDTLRAIDEDKAEHKVRLVGIDAPELGQAFGRVARDRLAELVKQQQVVVHLRGQDRYKRDLAEIKVGGGMVNRQLVAEGLAWHFTPYSDDADLAAAEAEARAARRGLWADAKPVPPWEWRAGAAARKKPARP